MYIRIFFKYIFLLISRTAGTTETSVEVPEKLFFASFENKE